ncbi:hypothetical protein MICRO80W_810001 [Micrococcus luteus]|nr:hypothetical protein MICRO80W_810001 [Micrococcus luteus]
MDLHRLRRRVRPLPDDHQGRRLRGRRHGRRPGLADDRRGPPARRVDRLPAHAGHGRHPHRGAGERRRRARGRDARRRPRRDGRGRGPGPRGRGLLAVRHLPRPRSAAHPRHLRVVRAPDHPLRRVRRVLPRRGRLAAHPDGGRRRPGGHADRSRRRGRGPRQPPLRDEPPVRPRDRGPVRRAGLAAAEHRGVLARVLRRGGHGPRARGDPRARRHGPGRPPGLPVRPRHHRAGPRRGHVPDQRAAGRGLTAAVVDRRPLTVRNRLRI